MSNQINEWYRAEAKLEAVNEGSDSYEVGDDGTVVPPDWYEIGNPDYRDREVLMLIIEAARNVCGVAPAHARKLLAKAIKRLDKREPRRGFFDEYRISF